MIDEKRLEEIREQCAGLSDLALVTLLQERISHDTEKILAEAELGDYAPIPEETVSANLPEPELAPDGVNKISSNGTIVVQHSDNKANVGWEIICSNCKQKASVPFKPNPKYPAYCRPCYDKKQSGQLEGVSRW